MSRTSAAPDPASIMILRMLHAYQERLRGLPCALDTSTWAANAHDLPVQLAKDWRQVCTVLGVRQVGLPTLLAHAHRLAVLGPEDLHRVLAARAFYARRGALARCIDGAYLSGLAAVLGLPALSGLTAREHWAQDAGGPLPALDVPQLAQAGLQALIAEGSVTDPSLAQLMQLTIGIQVPLPVCASTPIFGALTAPFMAALPILFPELSWLFG
ncbi:hypothetical protein PI87_24160 [Ralstonia sp. A12]|uniref:type III secretion protein HrpB4 n=1 Tax=Ralstonia sp. A12 TaxID=1217052 RepID=UPI000573123B|nr:type III secretion protein HrpB4 [Ralstonia sp. A12]KHK49851.1 hypothetical protein PI87_24160 [Ralstonia sp. A12]